MKDRTQVLEFQVQCTQKYGKVYRLWDGPLRARIFCAHPETVKAVTSTSAPKNMLLYGLTVPWLGE